MKGVILLSLMSILLTCQQIEKKPAGVSEKRAILLLGESNCSGVALLTELTSPYVGIIPNAKIWVTGSNSFNDLQSGVNNGGNALTDHGIELPFMYELAQISGTTSYLVKYGVGGAKIGSTAGADWLPSLNELYLTYKNSYFTPAINSLKASFPGQKIKVTIIFIEGANDATVPALASAYGTNYATIMNQIKTDVLALGSTEIEKELCYRVHTGFAGATSGDITLVRTGTETYVSGDTTKRRLVSADSISVMEQNYPGLPGRVHYDSPGMVELAERMLEAYLD